MQTAGELVERRKEEEPEDQDQDRQEVLKWSMCGSGLVHARQGVGGSRGGYVTGLQNCSSVVTQVFPALQASGHISLGR